MKWNKSISNNFNVNVEASFFKREVLKKVEDDADDAAAADDDDDDDDDDDKCYSLFRKFDCGLDMP